MLTLLSLGHSGSTNAERPTPASSQVAGREEYWWMLTKPEMTEVARKYPPAIPEEARFLSFTDHLLTENLKEWIKATFPNRPIWEIG